MLGNWLPQLSPTAKGLLSAERSRSEDEALKVRALERAEAALEGERGSGFLLRRVSEQPTTRSSSAWLRGAVLAAAALGFASLAAAGVRLAINDDAASNGEGRTKPPVVPAVAPVAAKGALSLDPSSRSAPDAEAIATPEPSPAPSGSNTTTRSRPGAKQYLLELGLLEPARSSIARGDFNLALGAIARHQREYPGGLLAEEREALRVRALWGMGQKSAAQAAASSFRKRYPRSGLLSWMKERPAP